ncbi:MAG: alcohol dehydrogenase catalytic domain-containing protein [Firmicutes bacterium]|nr:alcohol dehydrogenase catalytic domain-containing protein [Bacillota bacterium]
MGMKAALITPGISDSLRIEDVPEPVTHINQVKVRTLDVGICGTDRAIVQGYFAVAPKGEKDLILGHEMWGRVEQVGEQVKDMAVGDYVVGIVRRPDDCVNCVHGEYDMCSKGHYQECGVRRHHGFLREFFAVQPEFLVKVSANLGQSAVLLEPLSIAQKAIKQVKRAQQRLIWQPQRALVLGAGPIGLLTALTAQEEGWEVTVASLKEKTAPPSLILTQTGIRYVQVKPPDILDKFVGEPLFDVIVNATSSAQVVLEALPILNLNGVMTLVGLSLDNVMHSVHIDNINHFLVMGNRLILGAVSANRSHFESGAQQMLLWEQRWPGLLSQMITRTEPLSRIRQAIVKQPGEIKTIVHLANAGS